jgi:hypothetical protein
LGASNDRNKIKKERRKLHYTRGMKEERKKGDQGRTKEKEIHGNKQNVRQNILARFVCHTARRMYFI